MNCGVGRRRGSDLVLWLWHRAATTAPIRPLAWVPPYAMGVALKRHVQKKKKKKLKKRNIMQTTKVVLIQRVATLKKGKRNR